MIHGGGGDDLIFGGGNGDILCGDKGNDTIYAGPGNETLYGGDGQNSTETGWLTDPTHQQAGDSADAGSNLLIGGPASEAASGSTTLPVTFQLTGNTAIGSNTITALPSVSQLTVGQMVSGPGIPFGTTVSAIDSANSSVTISNNASAAGAGGTLFFTSPNQPTQLGTVAYNDVIYGDSTGRSTLRGGPGSDTLYAGLNGDYLAAGTGIDALIGGPGDATVCNSSGNRLRERPEPLDKVVGGAGVDTLIIKGMPGGTINGAAFSGDNNIDLTQQPGTTNQYQATLTDLDVTNGPVIGQLDFTMPPDVEGIALEGGPENNQITVDPSVTTGVYVYGSPGNRPDLRRLGQRHPGGRAGQQRHLWRRERFGIYGGDVPAQDNQHQPAASIVRAQAISPPSVPRAPWLRSRGRTWRVSLRSTSAASRQRLPVTRRRRSPVTAPAPGGRRRCADRGYDNHGIRHDDLRRGRLSILVASVDLQPQHLDRRNRQRRALRWPRRRRAHRRQRNPANDPSAKPARTWSSTSAEAGRGSRFPGWRQRWQPGLADRRPRQSLTAVMFAGNGSDTLVGDNSGFDVMAAGRVPATSSSAITGTITSRAAAATTHSWAGRALTISGPAGQQSPLCRWQRLSAILDPGADGGGRF